MNWKKKWDELRCQFVYISDDGLVSIFKSIDGYRYEFIPSVMIKDSTGYATSTHFWKTLKGVKLHLEKNIHFMVVINNDNEKNYGEYEITDGKIIFKF